MQENELQRKVNTSVRTAFRYLYDIHRALIIGRDGVGSDVFAEAYGNLEVAADAVKASQSAASEAWDSPNCNDELAEEAARNAAINVFNQARVKNLIFLRDGTRSATIVRAYLIASNF